MAASNVQFIVQSIPAKETQFRDKLKALSERRSFYAQVPQDVPPVLQELQRFTIRQCVVGPKHLAFLLEDMRVCRIRYEACDFSEEDGERLDIAAKSNTKPPKIGERPVKVRRTGSSPWIVSAADLSSSGSAALRRRGAHIGVIRSMASSSSGSSSLTTSSTTISRNRGRNSGSEPTTILGPSSAGVRLVRTSQLRGRGLPSSLLSGQRVIVPASHVPEELVNQVQGILQGKSRNIIIRELQRTNLDVNLAVNNLLSRDDEDNDDADENGTDYMPGEDLLSLLDSGIHPGQHGVFIDTDVLPEELLGYTLNRASRTSSNQRGGNSGGGENISRRESFLDRDPIIRLRGHRFFEPLCSYESDQDELSQQSKSGSSLTKKGTASKQATSVNLADDIEWWMDEEDFVKFVQIGAMQSELTAIDTSGSLRQWRWAKDIPYRHPTDSNIFHPRSQFLAIEDKKVVSLATCSLRASVLVETGGVATWIDESVARHASVLEHPVTAINVPDLTLQFGSSNQRSIQNKCLHVCSLYTAVFSPSGEIRWWGVLPFHLRKKILEKAQTKLKKTLTPKKAATSNEVTIGSLVYLNSCPLFQAGAIAIHTRSGKPKVGCLQQSVWNFTEKYFFKILKRKSKKCKCKDKDKKSREKGENETENISSQVSETPTGETAVIQGNSERETVLKSTSGAAIVESASKPQKRKFTTSILKSVKQGDKNEKQMDDDIKEQWSLQDVIFIEDLQTVPIGKVVKIDGDMVAVVFRKRGKSLDDKMNKKSVLKNMRLLRKSEVHVLSSGPPPKVPECIVKYPRKIPLDPAIKIHSICVNEMGIEAMEGGFDGNPLQYISINMLGKITSDALPTPPEMFFDQKQLGEGIVNGDICKLNKTCQDFVTLFRDQNSCLYPLLRNENFGIRDPLWFNLTPLTAVGTGVHAETDLVQKDLETKPKMVVVTALVFKSHLMMPLIIHRDHKGADELLDRVTPNEIQAICEERCDGKRNIFHVAVSVTAPTSNQNQEEEKEDHEDKGRKEKEPRKCERYRSLVQAMSTTSVSTASTESAGASAAHSLPSVSSRTSSGPHPMSQSERVDAVNAIANAISVVTRGERAAGADTRSRPGLRDAHNSSVSSDPFVVAVPPPPYRPLTTLPPLSSPGFSSRFMRDIMQQFAAVLDDQPSSSIPNTATSSFSTTSSASSSLSAPQMHSALTRDPRPSAAEEAMETLPTPYRSSPTPAIPTSSWPPDPVNPFFNNPVFPPPDEGLNLSVSNSGSAIGVGRYSGKTAAKRLKRKRSSSPSSDVLKPMPKRGTEADGLRVIKILCSSEALKSVLFTLLSQKNALGHTPFMSAIYCRAYPAALEIMKQALVVAKNRYDNLHPTAHNKPSDSTYKCDNPDYKEILMSMLFPNESDPDANPIYLLCANDTCSFTWTGAQHINQDIFECWTCGLTGTLCCCSECARVCHNGHDCKLKRTSPTAYCDCWEKCACRSLIAGNTQVRTYLLQKLLQETKLVELPNGRGETVLQFLALTVARQSVEQRQHRSRTTTSSAKNGRSAATNVGGEECDIPQHDLQPPFFCKEAFMNLLSIWSAVRSTVMSGSPGHMDPLCASSLLEMSTPDALSNLLPQERQFMMSQTGTSRLDAFTLCLLVKCNTMYLDILLETLINQVQKTDATADKDDDLEVVHRFVRSLVRVFVVQSICSSSENYPGKLTSRNLSNIQPLRRVQRAFNALLPMAVKELCEMAVSLIDPARLGIARPTLPFVTQLSSADIIHSCETVFSRVPFPPRGESKRKMHGEMRRNQDMRRDASRRSPTATSRQSKGSIARRGLSRLRSQNSMSAESPRVISAPARINPMDQAPDNTLASDAAGGDVADQGRDEMQALGDLQAGEESTAVEGAISDYQPLTDDENDEGVEWPNDDEPENNEDMPEENPSQITVTVEEMERNPERNDEEVVEMTLPPAVHNAEGSDQQHDAVSEGDLDVDDEDADDQQQQEEEEDDEEEEEEVAHDDQDDEESDMDLTLLAGSEADTDAGSDQTGEEDDNSNIENNESDRIRELLYMNYGNDEMSELIMEPDDDDDTNGDDGDAEYRRNAAKNSEDEAAPATEPENEDESSQEEEDYDNEDEEGDVVNSLSDWVELPLERAPTRQARSRAAMAPHSMRWALGGLRAGASRIGPGAAAGRPPRPGSGSAGGSMIYIDPLAIRRSSNTGVGSSVPPGGSSGDSGKRSPSPSCSAATTNAELARAFGICVREVSNLLSSASRGDHLDNVPLNTFLELTQENVYTMRSYVEETLSETWKWLLTVIDSNEAQLRYGQVLSLAGSPSHSDHPLHKGTGKSQRTDDAPLRAPLDRRGAITTFSRSAYARTGRELSGESNAARQDFLTYMLSLMRAHSGEHADYLPVVDVSSLRHVAYVLDALVFYLRETSSISDTKETRKVADPAVDRNQISTGLNLGYDNTDDEDDGSRQELTTFPDELYSLAVSDVLVGDIIANAQEEVDLASPYAYPQKTYFRRSESMMFLGCSDEDLFSEPIVKALPLADKPHLLQPNARREELFGRPRLQIGGAEDASYYDPDLPGTGMGLYKHKVNAKFQKLEHIKEKRRKKPDAPLFASSADKLPMEQDLDRQNSGKTDHPIQTKACAETEAMDCPSTEQGSSKSVIMKLEGTEKYERENGDPKKIMPANQHRFTPPSVDLLLSRCRLTLELFSKVFLNDVGTEPKSILQQFGGFEVREAKFRKEMEKLRNSQSLDLQLNVERAPHQLIQQTFKQLNQHYHRRTGSSSTILSAASQPLAVQRVKVVFKDEPGEGSGVARSFYTALCEGLLSSEKLPPLDNILIPQGSSSSQHSPIPRMRKREHERLSRTVGKKVNLRSYFMARYAQQSASIAASPSASQLSTQSQPFYSQADLSGRSDGGGWTRYKQAIGNRLLPKVNQIHPNWSHKITGMLLNLPISQLVLLLGSDNMLRIKVDDASRRLTQIQYNGEQEQSKEGPDLPNESRPGSSPLQLPSSLPTTKNKNEESTGSDHNSEEEDEEEVNVSTFPLFYQPGKRGFYSPVAGPVPKKVQKQAELGTSKNHTPLGYEARLNAFRNVGRILGLCLLQNELCPLPLNRHVLKALLGRKINWHDFAFFDPVLYESMRYMLAECESSDGGELLESLDINFVVDAHPEEGGGEVELIPSGASVNVKPSNVRDYVRGYTTYRMIVCCHKFVDQMREGLFDVLPRSSLDGLTAEDLRLLVNGCGRVNVRTLVSYTSFNDESGKSAGSSAEKLTEFKRWFWTVIERLGHAARQELLYFWTGSPALPASEDGFQPMPTVTIRPPDDQHLPTANTCISRLYVPLYSSRTILKQKLTMAIKTKNFGFV